jgi:hypothetical protein
MEITVAPMGEFAAGPEALMPEMEGLAETRPDPWNMMISHLLMSAGGHFNLLQLISVANIVLFSLHRKRHFVPFRMKQSHAFGVNEWSRDCRR